MVPYTPIILQPATHIKIHSFDLCGPAIQAFPSFLAETNYQDLASNNKTPFQKAFNTELTCFQWLPQQPELFRSMQHVMSTLQSSDWITGLDILEQEARAVPSCPPQPSERSFFVDVGGGYGHQCTQLLKQHPNLHGRLVLQDLPQALDHLPPIDGVKAMAQDFFEKQANEGMS